MDEAQEPGGPELGSSAFAARDPGPGPETAPMDPPEPLVRPLPPSYRTSVRVMFGFGRTVLALAAVSVLAVTGYNWTELHKLDEGIARTDVFGTTAPAAPGASSTLAPMPVTNDINILVVGLDSRIDPHGNPLPANELAALHAGPNDGELNTDTMILVHIPAGGQQAVAISFPRDSWVQLAGGYGYNRLNAAFAFAHNTEASKLRGQGMTDAAQIEQQADLAGRQNLIATIEQLIGNTVQINRYAEINLAGFYQMSLAVGGVQVCLNQATSDSYSGASFPAGVQTISGAQALAFVRQRHGLLRGDLDRIVRQQAFLGALAHKVLSTGILTNPAKIDALTTAIQNSITLSTGWDITTFAEQMQNLSSGAIQFATIPTGNNVVIGGADVTQINQPQVERFVNGLVNGVNDPSYPSYDGGTPVTTPGGAPTTTTNPATSTTAPTTTPITADGIRCVD